MQTHRLNHNVRHTVNGARVVVEEVAIRANTGRNGEIVLSTYPTININNPRQSNVIRRDDLTPDDKATYDAYYAMIRRIAGERVDAALDGVDEIASNDTP
jgi:hypothetical protein